MSCKVFLKREEYFVIKYFLKNVYQNKIDFTSLTLEICKKNLYLINFFNELLNIDLKKDDTYIFSVNKLNLKINKYIKLKHYFGPMAVIWLQTKLFRPSLLGAVVPMCFCQQIIDFL